MTNEEPWFLNREQVDALHDFELRNHGGQPGLRDENSLESAIHQPQNVYFYGRGDHYDVAAAYAFHIAENQPYIDGNKRAGMAASLVYLDLNGIDVTHLPEQQTYEMMISIANKTATRDDLADLYRSTLEPKIELPGQDAPEPPPITSKPPEQEGPGDSTPKPNLFRRPTKDNPEPPSHQRSIDDDFMP